MNKLNIAYWTVNALLAVFMIFSSFDNVVTGEQSVAFIHDKMATRSTSYRGSAWQRSWVHWPSSCPWCLRV